MKSSRSSANIFSASTNDARRARNVRAVCDDEEDREQQHDLVDVVARRPVLDRLDELSEQRRPGEARGRRGRVEPDHAGRARACAGGASSRACARSSGPSAIGSSSLTGPPRA